MNSEFSRSSDFRESGEPGRLIRGRYTIQRKLGEGGFGETFLAQDRDSGRPCVLKRLSWKEIPDWKTIELFEREARVLSQMDHPQIPRFIEFFTEEAEPDTSIYLVQEHIEGKNLAEWIREGKHFTEKEVIGMALQVTDILEYLHNFSPAIIHRDIKPSNLLLEDDGQLHLIDFGAVRDKVLHWQKTEPGGFTVVGTYGYMPFEQFQGQAVPASDIYSLGVSLISLLSHKEPHEMQITGSRFEFEPHVNVSKQFEMVLRKMVEHRPEDRYQTAASLKQDLEAILAGREPEVAAVKQGKPGRVFPVVMALALIAALLGVWLFRSPQPVPERTTPVVATAPEVSVPAPRPVIAPYTGPKVHGRILFDGKPVTEVTKMQPKFWFRNEDLGTEASAEVVYENGTFEIRGLAPGQYGVSVQFDTNQENPVSYPGDLRAWNTFSVLKESTPMVVVDLQKIIHMVKPVNNGQAIRDWNNQCETGNPIHPSSVAFQWASIGEGVFYDYTISRLSCPYNTLEAAASGTVSGTVVRVNLPPSKKGEFYLLQLYGRKDGRNVGMLMTHGASGYGWDYRFRVE